MMAQRLRNEETSETVHASMYFTPPESRLAVNVVLPNAFKTFSTEKTLSALAYYVTYLPVCQEG